MAEPTWNAYHTSTPSGGPIAAVGAGLTLFDGWIDETGSLFTVNSSNVLRGTSGGQAYHQRLIRPVGEILVNQRLDWTTIEAQGGTGKTCISLRAHAGAGGSTDAYLFYIHIPSSITEVYKTSGGSLSQITSGSFTLTTGSFTGSSVNWAAAYNSAHTYLLSARAWGSAPNNLRLLITDVTAAATVVDFVIADTDSNLAPAGNFGLGWNDDATIMGSSGAIILYQEAVAATQVPYNPWLQRAPLLAS